VRSGLDEGSGLGWWAAAACLAVAATGLLIAGLLPGPAVPATIDAPSLTGVLTFDADVLADIAAYRGPRRAVVLASRMLAVAVPLACALVLLRASALPGRPGRRGRSGPSSDVRLQDVRLQVGALSAAVVVVTALARLPLGVWSAVVQDGRWGFRTRSVTGWALDQLAVISGRAALVGVLAAVFTHVVTRHPRTWPARVTVLVAVVGPLMLLLHPLVVHPVLLPTGPLPDGPHRDAVLEVVDRSGVDAPVLLGRASLRTTRRNAVATGLGPTRRVVLHDTLLDLSPREVAAIAAHELAHLERRDPLRGALAPVPLVLSGGLLVRRRIGRWAGGADPARAAGPSPRTLAAAVAFVIAAEASLTPVSAAVSRTIEDRTDVRSVMLSADPDAHVALLRAFVIDGLVEPEPPRWSVLLWATHPTPAHRIRAVSAAGVSAAGVVSAGDDPSTAPLAMR